MRELGDLGTGAVIYAGGWGWPVFRLRPNSKLPATSNGFHDATTDSATVVEEWTRDPNANVGIATGAVSGLVVIDVDPGGDVTVEMLKRTLGPLPPTLVALTPKGAHAYFRHPGVEIRCSAGRLGPGVDVRADGGYIVAPPSRLPDGEYRWRLPDGQAEPLPSELADLPAAWVAALREGKGANRSGNGSDNYARAAVAGELEAVRTASEGSRNTQLNASAFALGKFVTDGRVPESEIVELLVAAARQAGQRGHPFTEQEARRTIRSALDARKRG